MSKHRHLPSRAADGVLRAPRQVLIPGTNRQAPHPWRARLRAAMDGQPTTKAMEKVRGQRS